MKTIGKTIIVLTIIFLKSLTAGAQLLTVSKNEIGVGVGVFVYQGDLTPSRFGSYKTLKPALDLFVNHALNSFFALRTNLAFGALKGDDSKYASPVYRQQRNFNFRSPVFEVSEMIVASPLGDNRAVHPAKISPYVFAGAGLSILRIRRDYSHFNSEFFASEATTLQGLSTDAQHSLPRVIPVIPVGIGIKYSLSQNIMITAETSYRHTFTDYLDGFSKAANDQRKDSYQTHTIGIIYRFVSNNSLKCPVF